jgi:hypothetical protein
VVTVAVSFHFKPDFSERLVNARCVFANKLDDFDGVPDNLVLAHASPLEEGSPLEGGYIFYINPSLTQSLGLP